MFVSLVCTHICVFMEAGAHAYGRYTQQLVSHQLFPILYIVS